MSEPLTDEDRLIRAKRAKHLLEDPLIVHGLTAYRDAIWTAWMRSKPADTEGRERLYYQARACETFEASLRNVVDTGKILVAEEQRRLEAEEQEPSDGDARFA